MNTELLNKEELAARLKVSKRTIQKLIATNRIPVIRIGYRTVVFDYEKVVEALKK